MALHDDYFAFWQLALKGYREMYGLSPIQQQSDKELRTVRYMAAEVIGKTPKLQINQSKLMSGQPLDAADFAHIQRTVKPVEKYPGELDFIHETAQELANPDGAAVFYFDDIDVSNDETLVPLADTAGEFYREGLLSPPFPKTLFIFRHTKLNVTVPVLAQQIEGGYKIVSFITDYPLLLSPASVLPGCAIDYKREYAGTLTGGNLINLPNDELAQARALFAPADMTPDDLKLGVASAVLYFLLGSMLLNMPHYEAVPHDIDEKLRRAREKNGKPPLKSYTVVRPVKAVRDEMQDGAGGWKVKPHWRRGHIRTLSDGRKVPVQPCMVNFKGDGELAKNTYMFKGDKNVAMA